MTDKINDNDVQTVAPTKTPFRVISGDREVEVKAPAVPATQPELPENDYVVVDFDDNQHFATGFLVFTSQHVAVMKEYDEDRTVPVLVLPLSNVKFAQLYNAAEDVQVELPL